MVAAAAQPARTLTLLIAAALATSCAGPFQSVADMTRLSVASADTDQYVRAARLNPKFAYLRVQGPSGPAALMVLGYEDTGVYGPVQTWYSAGQETLQLEQGRIRLTHGLPANRLSTRWLQGLPDLQTIGRDANPVGNAPGRSTGNASITTPNDQVIALAEGGPREFRLSLSISPAPVSEVPATVMAQVRGEPGSRAAWRWYREDARVAQPGHPLHGQIWFTQWTAINDAGWVFGHQCIQPDYCLSLQPWSPSSQPLGAGRSPAPEARPATHALTIQAGERASDWLLRAAGPVASNGVAHWLVDQERAPQARLKAEMLAGLDSRHWPALNGWLGSQPITGRVPLQTSQGRSLQVRPSEDPVLTDQDRMRWHGLPAQVAVVNEHGAPCLVPHVTGAYAAQYVEACSAKPAAQSAAEPPSKGPVRQASWAWIVQPEGETHRAGIAAWNASNQPEPAPGAWIWAPSDAAHVPAEVSGQIAQWLATQAPANTEAAGAPTPSPLAQPAGVRPAPASPASIALTASDWGEIGLLQTPTARMAPAGAARFNITRMSPYTHGNVMFQPLDWLEFGFRYTNLANLLYGPSIAGTQDLKDKSIDVKVRLFEETAWLPQVALGIRDLGGTGLFSGEYLVANKRWGAWDFSLGLGWGYLGGRGDLGNPLRLLGDRWGTRPPPNTGQGGVPGFDTFFRGPAALFGGAQYQFSDRWVFKAEYDGNDYQREPRNTTQRQSSPINLGLVFRQNPWLDWALGLERGNTLMLGVTLHTGPQGLQGLAAPKLLDPPLPPVRALTPRATAEQSSEGQSASTQSASVHPPQKQQTGSGAPVPPRSASASTTTAISPANLQALKTAIRQRTGWALKRLSIQGEQAVALIETDAGVHARERLQSVTRLLHAALPPEVQRMELGLQQRGMRLARVNIDRQAWVQERTTRVPPSLQDRSTVLGSADAMAGSRPDSISSSTPTSAPSPTSAAIAATDIPDAAFTVALGPSYQQILGGPDGFLLFKLGAQLDAQLQLAPGTWLAGSADLRLIDNYDRFKYTAPSDLPRVRTYAREYATASRLTIPLLQAQHVQSLGGGHHVSVYGGLLEPMFGGAGAEWFWRPWSSRVALGLDINRVWQRSFEQDLSFRDYRVTTGHLSVYWDTGWNDVHAKVMVGQYLAGDVGATLDIRRQFANGIAIGAWATKTNVSAAQFGEGSFDKGIYLSVPFDALLARSTPGVANIVYNPLTRDGGARLQRRYTLEELTRQGGRAAWEIGVR